MANGIDFESGLSLPSVGEGGMLPTEQISEAEIAEIGRMPMKEYMEWRKIQTPEKLAAIDAALGAVDNADSLLSQEQSAQELRDFDSDPTIRARNGIVVANPFGALEQGVKNTMGRQGIDDVNTQREDYAAQQAEIAALRRELEMSSYGR